MNEQHRKKMVLFGAGNIGRSFVGQLFGRGGYEVVFVEVNPSMIRELNRRGRYRVVVKRNDGSQTDIWVEHVRAVDGRDQTAVAEELANADIAATAVGQSALPAVLATLGHGLDRRFAESGSEESAPPLDIIIAENIRDGARIFKKALSASVSEPVVDRLVGLVETSIGKMVPIMKPEDLAQDPLWIFAEEYNTLIVDRAAFRSAIPEVPGIKPVDNIRAYVDRKLFIHNLGHASCAYLGYSYSHELTTIAEAITIPEVHTGTRDAMLQSAEALLLEYPQTFSRKELVEHVEDLLTRFANRQLGDTIYRVGRDLYRKLGREDRLVGAMLLAQRHSCDYDAISRAFAAALQFAALSSDGELFPGDREFRELELPRGVASILTRVSKLDPALPEDRMVFRTVKATAEGGKSE